MIAFLVNNSIGVPEKIVIQSTPKESVMAKTIPGYRWNAIQKQWEYPVNRNTIELSCKLAKVEDGTELHKLSLNLRRYKNLADLAREGQLFVDYNYRKEMPPYDYQRIGTSLILASWGVTNETPRGDTIGGRTLNLDEMGLGKTKQAIDAASSMFERGLIERVIVVSPLSIKNVWCKEIQKHSCVDRPIVFVDGTATQRTMLLDYAMGRQCWVLLNYDQLRAHPATIQKLVKGQVLIGDEIHHIKNIKSKKSTHFLQLDPKYSVCLSGTLSANKPDDVFNPVNFTSPGLVGLNFYQFRNRYCDMGGYGGHTVINYKNLSDLRDKIKSISIRRLEKDVQSLPERIYHERSLPLSGSQLDAYNKMRDDLIAYYEHAPQEELNATNVLSQMSRLRQIADGFIKDGDKPASWYPENAKLEMLDESLAECFASGKRASIVFVQFIPIGQRICDLYSERNSAFIYGKTSPQERLELTRELDEGKIKLLVAQLQVASEGLDFTAADNAHFIDRPWTAAGLAQAEKRLHRNGQDRHVHIFKYSAQNTIDEYLDALIAKKTRWSENVMGDEHFTRTQIIEILKGDFSGVDG